MLIACPSCATAYPIDPAAVGRAGPMLHCAQCNASWLAEGPEFPADLEAFADPAIAQAELPATAPAPALTFGEMAFTPFSPAAFRSPGKDNLTAEPVELMAEIDFPALLAQPVETDDVAIAAEVEAAEPFETIEQTALAPPIEDEPLPAAANGDLDSEYIESFAARRRRLQARRKENRRSSDWTAVLVLIACSVTAVSARSEVVRYLPHTASLFAAIGLPVNLRHLEFENVKIAVDHGTLTVQGAIVSSADKPTAVPRLHFAARNATGQEIYTWTERPSRSILAPGERMEFDSRVTSPPPGASNVMVRFASAQDVTAAAQ